MHLFQLDNGLQVAIRTMRNRVVTIDAWVNTGAFNEPARINGLSHFLEHMLFKGTPTHGPGELDRIIMAVGGVWNAGTSYDFTHYYVTVASPYFGTALGCISDMLQNAIVDDAEFDSERQVILEEWRRKEDSPHGVLYDELFRVAFGEDHANTYGRTVLGSFESISALTAADARDYYRRYYTADNMILCVVGDIDPVEAEAQIREAFAGLRPKAEPLPLATAQPIAVPAEPVRIPKDVMENYMALGWPAPPISNLKEVLAMDVASVILGQGRSSRLYRRLKEETRLVNSISGGYMTMRHPAMAYVMATCAPENGERAAEEIQAVVTGLKSAPPDAAELEKAKHMLRTDHLFSLETTTGQSGFIGYYYTLTGDTSLIESYADLVNAVTADDVVAVAEKYLSGASARVEISPELEKAGATE